MVTDLEQDSEICWNTCSLTSEQLEQTYNGYTDVSLSKHNVDYDLFHIQNAYKSA